MDTDQRTSGDVRVFGCVDCPRVSSISARGWKAYWIEDPGANEDEPHELAFRCPNCSRRE